TATSRSDSPKPRLSRNARSSAVTAPRGTLTPLGRPVEPEVKMVYASAAGSTGRDGAAAAPSETFSTTTPGPAIPAARSASDGSVSSTRSPESAAIRRSRSAGYAGSSGTYAPPAHQTPSMAGISAAVRGRNRPTGTSGPT